MKKILFWLVQLTWNIFENIIGSIVCLVLLVVGFTPKRYYQCIAFEIGKNWGGVNFGFCIITQEKPSQYLLKHEHGHFIQAFFFGPFELIIQLMSAIRYWYRYIIKKINPNKNLPNYYDIWFEKQASDLGEKYLKD